MKEYSLSQLLSKFTLIIPEIQREYVWGSNKSVLESFISDINRRIESNHINVGFLYSYTVHGSEHYVIDGQQRLTSLVLLLFVLSCESEDTRTNFQNLLRVEKPTMAFSYNVRPMTEVFLRELFSHECKTSDEIKEQKWYLSEYDNDPTIKSVLGALDLFSSKDLRSNITYDDLLRKVFFWYFAVKETSQGEELYITMNSRGQKLTDSEQIKPRLFKSLSGDKVKEYGKEWDDWEEYFYSNRPQQGTDDAIHQVDLALNNFIRVVKELETADECNELKDCKGLTLPILKRWFEALEQIPSEEQFQKEIQRLYGTKEDRNFMVLKSLLVASFVGVNSNREFERVRQTMRNRVIRRGEIKKHTSLLKFLDDYRSFHKESGNNSLYEFILSNNDTDVMDDKDRKKITILVRQRDESLENLFWEAEDHCILKGDISPLLDWVCEQPEDFSIEKFEQYYHCFCTLFESTENALKQDKDKDLDLVRRALLARRINDYPRHFDGWTNKCFAYAPKDWRNLFVKNNPEMKAFFDKLLEGGEGEEKYKEVMQQMIKEYKEAVGDLYGDFVKEPKLLEYCQEKNIQWWWDTIYLITKRTARSNHANLHAYKYYLHLKDKKTEGWQLYFDSSDMTYTYYSQTKDTHRIRISMQWNVGKDHSQMEIGCFMDSKNEYPFGESYLKEAVEPLLDYKWNNEGNYYALLLDMQESDQVAFGKMDEHCKKLMDSLAKLGL